MQLVIIRGFLCLLIILLCLLKPLAEDVLSDADWAELDQAFSANRDPLTGHEPEADYGALFTRIVNIVPAPVGLGAASPSD